MSTSDPSESYYGRRGDFKKWANPGLFFVYFQSFQKTIQFLQQINVKKFPSSIQCRDLNPEPLEHESPPITTRRGASPIRI